MFHIVVQASEMDINLMCIKDLMLLNLFFGRQERILEKKIYEKHLHDVDEDIRF